MFALSEALSFGGYLTRRWADQDHVNLRDGNEVEACPSSRLFGKAYFAVSKARSRDRSAPETPHIACLQLENILSRYNRVYPSPRHF